MTTLLEICGEWAPFRARGIACQGREVSATVTDFGLFTCDPVVTLRRVANRRTIMRSILDIILLVLQIYIWLLIAAAVLSWLIAFNVVNARNQVVAMIADFLWRITEPLLRPIRALLPNLGGIDISPVILILIILFLENVIIRYIYPNVF
jgi:YggT family protein